MPRHPTTFYKRWTKILRAYGEHYVEQRERVTARAHTIRIKFAPCQIARTYLWALPTLTKRKDWGKIEKIQALVTQLDRVRPS